MVSRQVPILSARWELADPDWHFMFGCDLFGVRIQHVKTLRIQKPRMFLSHHRRPVLTARQQSSILRQRQSRRSHFDGRVGQRGLLLKTSLNEVVEHPVGLVRRSGVEFGLAFHHGFLFGEGMQPAAEIEQLPIDAGTVHFSLKQGNSRTAANITLVIMVLPLGGCPSRAARQQRR